MNRWQKLKHILACSCHSAAELSSRRLEERLPLSDRLALAGHLLVCRSCRHFNRQVTAMRTLVRTVATRFAEAAASEETLSAEARDKITRAIRDAAAQ